jgi:hypothetical protein
VDAIPDTSAQKIIRAADQIIRTGRSEIHPVTAYQSLRTTIPAECALVLGWHFLPLIFDGKPCSHF